MTLKFNSISAVMEIYVRAKLYRAKCSGSRVIVLTKNKKYYIMAPLFGDAGNQNLNLELEHVLKLMTV